MSALDIIVCLKQTPDPEAPISGYRVDSEAKRMLPIGIPPVISPFDENALEVALRLREACGGKITALSVGYKLSKAVFKKALAVGADELVLVDDEAYDGGKLDGWSTALLLAEAIRKLGGGDLVMTGRQAADTNAGVVGIYLADILGMTCVTLARSISCDGHTLRIERILPDAQEVIETTLPTLVTVSSEAGELRSMRIEGMRDAKKKPFTQWSAKDLGAPHAGKTLHLVGLSAPRRERTCRFIESDSIEEAGANLAKKLVEEKAL
ncbi:MAG: electron transfer flavoprotein subunit beta/FixA family protein [Candidatus Abyssubacteria bacterium]